MKAINSTLLLNLTLALLALAISGSACTSKKTPETTASGLPPGEIKLNSSRFQFDHEQTTELMIVKNDPISGDRWTARLAPLAPPTSASPAWKIVSAPERGELIDTLADGNLILHLLDTFRTLQPIQKAPEGTLASFGLNPPLFALRWSAGGSTHEIHLGDSNLKVKGTYATFPPAPEVYLVKGAALEMLTHFNSFDALRFKRLTPFDADDVDQIELKAPGIQWKTVRAGDVFEKAENLPKALEALTHQRILRFIDDPARTSSLKSLMEKSAPYQVTLSGRSLQPTVLRILSRDGKTFAMISSRPGAVFEVYPAILAFFKPLAKL